MILKRCIAIPLGLLLLACPSTSQRSNPVVNPDSGNGFMGTQADARTFWSPDPDTANKEIFPAHDFSIKLPKLRPPRPGKYFYKFQDEYLKSAERKDVPP